MWISYEISQQLAQASSHWGQEQEQALDIFPNPLEDPYNPAPGPSYGPSYGPSSCPLSGPSLGPVQIASMETDVVIHRQLVAQAEPNAALARDNLSFAKLMESGLRERAREAEAAVAAAREVLVEAEIVGKFLCLL